MRKTVSHAVVLCFLDAVVLCFLMASHTLREQATVLADAERSAAIERRMETLSTLLAATQKQLEQSQKQLESLRAELDAMKPKDSATAAQPPGASASSSSLTDAVAKQDEEQEILQAEIRQHEQTKLESESKYPVKVYGLVLFNAFSNAGVVDNPDLPTVAFARQPGASHGSAGASVRQTLFGVRAMGPRLWGARTAADASVDFFGDLSYNFYGSTTGDLRLRTADVGLAWTKDEVHLGVDSPLISPLSPSTFATVGIPSLGWAGNLWTWSPQLRYAHRFDVSDNSSFKLEGGLLDPSVVGVQEESAYRELSAGELSRRPSFEGRASYSRAISGQRLALGAGAYRGRESFSGRVDIATWAVTSDWQIPVTRRLQIDGEFYRGLGLGALGGGAYKDVLSGIDPVTGLNRTIGLNAIGGWGQAKLRLAPQLEANASMGLDSGFAGDLHRLTLSNAANFLELTARTHMTVGNLIYRPKTYLILSPEYRRIMNWNITGPAAVANIYTLSMGYQF